MKPNLCWMKTKRSNFHLIDMETKQLEFSPFGNVGVFMTKNVLGLCRDKLNYSVMTGLFQRCFEFLDNEEDKELFLLFAPNRDKLHIGICDTTYGRLASYCVANTKGLDKGVSLFYGNGKVMLVSEMVDHAF